jgi:hypothetical protein
MTKFVEVAVPEEHVMEVYRFLAALVQERREGVEEGGATVARLADTAVTARTAEMVRAQDTAP